MVEVTLNVTGGNLTSLLRSFKIDVEPVLLIYEKNNWLIIGLLAFLFIYLIIIGFYVNARSLKTFKDIFLLKGRLITDFTHSMGYGITFINMGMMGLICLVYILSVKGIVNGPVMAGILTVVGFAAFGKHIRNCLPITIGVIIAALAFGYDLSSTGIIISVLFSTTLAPIAGSYGFKIGILAGVIHMILVVNIGVIHGGINLYNNGFSGGLVAGFLVPVIDAFSKDKKK